MDCRLNYSEQIRQDILDTYGVGKTSATLIKPNRILLPIGGDTLKSKNNTYEWAIRGKKELDVKFNSKVYGSQVTIDNTSNPSGTLIDITIQSKLIDQYLKSNGNQVKMFQLPNNQVNAGLKSVDILYTQKAIDWFKKRDKANWSGDLFYSKLSSDLGIPKEQVELIKSLTLKNPYNREEILTNLLANYSYTITINKGSEAPGSLNDKNSSYYSNLTVPGGTNYTENEIATPGITPSIKGHAQFATDKGIGWGRWDEKVQYTEQDIDSLIDILKNSGQLEINCK